MRATLTASAWVFSRCSRSLNSTPHPTSFGARHLPKVARCPQVLVLSYLSLLSRPPPPSPSLSYPERITFAQTPSACCLAYSFPLPIPPPYSVFAHVYNVCYNNLIVTTCKDNKNIIFFTCIHTKFERPLHSSFFFSLGLHSPKHGFSTRKFCFSFFLSRSLVSGNPSSPRAQAKFSL